MFSDPDWNSSSRSQSKRGKERSDSVCQTLPSAPSKKLLKSKLKINTHVYVYVCRLCVCRVSVYTCTCIHICTHTYILKNSFGAELTVKLHSYHDSPGLIMGCGFYSDKMGNLLNYIDAIPDGFALVRIIP